MRLWHYKLLSKLPRQQLLGQHRECSALRGKGWGKPHSTINYIYNYSISKLVGYHFLVMEEMLNRGYNITQEWLDCSYRGKILGYDYSIKEIDTSNYIEHNEEYMQECLDNLKNKNIIISIDK